VVARSTDAIEAGTLLAESDNPLRRCLSWVDLAFLGFGSVVGSGLFVLTGQEASFDAGPAIPLAYAAAGFSALLSSFRRRGTRWPRGPRVEGGGGSRARGR
jgi:amino acid permease